MSGPGSSPAARLLLALLLACLRRGCCADVTTENVTYDDAGVNLTGYLAYPANATSRLPVLLHVHTWGGLSDFEKQRAERTAKELGYVGFAVSIYTPNETSSATSMQARIRISTGYSSAPARFVSRLKAALSFVRGHARADAAKIAAAGYCFGGTAVLQYAKLAGNTTPGVMGVVSFHGGLDGLSQGTANFGSVKVLVANGAADSTIPMDKAGAFQSFMTEKNASWEFATYGHAQHGFTHPKDGTAHYHFEKIAEERSWTSMADFLEGLGFANASTAPKKEVVTEDVNYSDGNVTLKGYVAKPKEATGSLLPAVLHVHTWAGLSDFEKKRAERTAAELGYVGFAVSVYTEEETTRAKDFQARVIIAGSYISAPERFQSRLAAATAFIKKHQLVDKASIGVAGYCFGGTAALQFARLGGAVDHGVAGVVSFHGSLTGMNAYPKKYCPTRVAIYNGADDPMITDSDIVSLAATLDKSKTQWEFTNYSFAQHGFTHPKDGTAHFHYEKTAEARSWTSMANFFNRTFMGEGKTPSASCVHEEMTPSNATQPAGCMDDNAAVKQLAGAFGITECAANLCTGQYAAQVARFCRQTCGMCSASTTAATATRAEQVSAAFAARSLVLGLAVAVLALAAPQLA